MCKLVPYGKDQWVADIKLRHINNIAEQAQKAKNIERIMLFGSATEERCKETSDIDIAVFGKETKGKYIDSKEFTAFHDALYQFDWDQDYDVLYFQDGVQNHSPIMDDIIDGVEIFRRSQA